MKTSLKVKQLIEKGLSKNTISKLTESQVDILYSRLLGEQVKQEKKQITKTTIPASTARTTGANVDGVSIKMDAAGNVVASQTTEGELDEDVEVTTDPNKETETQDPHQVGPSSNDGFNSDDDGMYNFESIEEGKKKANPWAICTSQMGKEFGTTERSEWTKGQSNKYERCVKDVKKSLKEGKNPLSLFLENEIMKIVERNLPPRITKGDLMKYLSEDTKTAPAKPKESPTTKPGKPDTRPKPKHPGQKPLDRPNPAPKAVSPEKAKDEVIDLIINLLDK